MREYSLKINLGIGDIIYTKAALDNVKSKFDIINISPNYSVIDQYRGGNKKYRKFVDGLFFLFFNEEPYKIVNDQSLSLKSLIHLMEDGITLCKPDLINYLVDPTLYYPKQTKDYITVSTKVRGLNAVDYVLKYRHLFIETLQSLEAHYSVFIIGEKRIGMNVEYLHHINHIFSIYDDLKFSLRTPYDITVNELGITSPNLVQLKDDCSLMSMAKTNICLGIGGNFGLAASVGNLINFRATKGDAVDCTSIMYKNEINDRVFSTDNFELFINKLEGLYNGHSR